MPNIRRGRVILNRQPIKIVKDFNIVKPTGTTTPTTLDTAWRLEGPQTFSGDDAIKIPVADIVNESSVLYFSADIKPESVNYDRMNIFEGQEVPISIYLKKLGANFSLEVSVNTTQGWTDVDAFQRVIRANQWTKIEVVFTLEEIYVFINDTATTRRLFYQNIPVSPGDHDYVIGAWIDGVRNAFKGEMKNILIESTIPNTIQEEILILMESGFGEIESKYQSLGGTHSFLGSITKQPENISRGSKTRLRQVYQHGEIYWSMETGAHEIHGDILRKYREYGSYQSNIGLPTTDEEVGYSQSCRRSRFESGGIYWSSQTGSHIVIKEVYMKYVTMGEDKSFLGLPTKNTYSKNGGLVSEFQRGNLYYHPNASIHEVHGAILHCYKNGFSHNFDIGFPTSDENILTKLNASNNEVDLGYRSSDFEHGTIYWSNSTGAHEVHGAIRRRYLELGGHRSSLGLPTSNEIRVGNGNIRYNNFQNGIIMWQSGIGAVDVTDIRLFIEKAKAGKIDDGRNWYGTKDKSAELLTYTTVKYNNTLLENKKRKPSGNGSSSSVTLNKTYMCRKIQGNSKIYMKVKYTDWDRASDNDYLGTIEKTYSIENFFGFKGKKDGIYQGAQMTHEGGDAYNLGTVKLDYSIGKPSVFDPNKAYRDQYWWPFDNFKTPTLSRQLFADTFTDVEVISGSLLSKLENPLDTAYYEIAYKGSAAGGNCFGMCLEALYAKKGKSKFTFPLSDYPAKGNKVSISTNSDLPKYLHETINTKHAYQLGSDAIWHLAGKFASFDALVPNWVYNSVTKRLRNGEPSIVCMFEIGAGGHAVLAYDYDAHSKKIYVCDPNLPYSVNADKNASYIQIHNNKFKFYKNGSVGFQSDSVTFLDIPTVFMFDYPYSVLSSAPSTPSVAIFIGLTLLLACVILIAGDAEVKQIKVNNKVFYNYKNNKQTINRKGIDGLVRIPLVDNDGMEFFALKENLEDKLEFRIAGKRQGQYTHTLQTKYNKIEVQSTIKANKENIIELENPNSSRPTVIIKSDEDKIFQVKYEVLNDQKGKLPVTIEVSLEGAKDRESKVALDALDGGLIIEQGKDSSAITVKQVELVNNKPVTSKLVIKNAKANELIKINPRLKGDKQEALIQRFDSRGILIKKEISKF